MELTSLSRESDRLLSGKLKLDFGNSLGRVETLGARAGAVEDGVATVQAHLILELLLSLLLVGIL